MSEERIAVIGLGYVGLPLAVALSRKFDTLGFDISEARITQLRAHNDVTLEVASSTLAECALALDNDPASLAGRTIYIVTVPTPIDEAKRPDLRALLAACETVGRALSPGSVVVFESTVYPGLTEEVCGPALERASGMRCGADFKLGYSPERINPGDRQHPLEKIVKVVAGQDPETLERLAAIYDAIVEAGIHKASSIKVAEAAKVIENTQRDLNIALMNEVSKICDLVGIRTADVLAAAATKWNFLKFHPGLVGGHCIGVDPYYLTAKAEQIGYRPEVILSGRRINDSMGAYVAQRLVKMLADGEVPLKQMRVGILGLTFKENVPDIRNSKVFDIVRELEGFGIQPIVHDPFADPEEVRKETDASIAPLSDFDQLNAVIMSVAHQPYLQFSTDDWARMVRTGGVFIDVKSCVAADALPAGIAYWSL